MNETYTRKQATEKLGLTSTSAFDDLKAKYPRAFVVVKQATHRGSPNLYEKQALDKFAKKYDFWNRQAGEL